MQQLRWVRQKRKGSCGTYVIVSLANLLDLGLIQLAARSIVCETSAGKAVPTTDEKTDDVFFY